MKEPKRMPITPQLRQSTCFIPTISTDFLANEEYTELIPLIKAFKCAFEHQWLLENKQRGFDVQDYRLGGLIERTKSCKKRLIDYAGGKISSIDELECDILPFGKYDAGDSIYYNNFRESASSNPF